ncbi:undecaprenyldiphospho-muramoylpentapeptide beta-N-acetylglucosaminyltransferase [Streptococcaceae bacterium ESL0687]|nr:undecaprenyldiphospho-muramoylpentapeptide beta-N-acetylglucosaminyltransferase [Streptococcaceae bacterium ESL0687]
MKIVVTGGGTGGHIYPALAFIRYLKNVESELEVLYVGTKHGLESKLVPEVGIDFETVDVQAFKRSFDVSNLKTAYKFVKSIGEAKGILKDFNPDIVLGMGGYASAPIVYAAAQLAIPTVLHEQDSIPGLTNKFLSGSARKIALGFQGTAQYFPEDKAVYTGNPRAQEVADLYAPGALGVFNMSTERKTVLIFGGSRGAFTINEAMLDVLPKFIGKSYQVVYVAGETYYREFEQAFKEYEEEDNIAVVPYISNMSEIMSNVDLLVSRAGATTIAEATALGLPSILIPSPHDPGNHQEKNAETLEKTGAAEVILDSELTGDRILLEVEKIFSNESVYRKMSEASLREGVPDSNIRLHQVIKSCLV